MKPTADLFNREREWSDLEAFISSSARGLQVGILYGRRRLGKSFLLRRLAQEHQGIYTMALEEEPVPALQRFADAVGKRRGIGAGQLRFTDWVEGLATALSGPERLLIIDELPYLLPHRLGATIPSALQHLVDESRNDPDAENKRVILCGSALAVMADLLSGSRALRGRAPLDMLLRPFDFRATAEYYGIEDPEVAFHMYAVFGGVPGYRDLLADAAPHNNQEFTELILTTVCNPSHALFNESTYLLREDPRITDRALYYSISQSVANGATSPAAIARELGRDTRSLSHPLDVLTTAGFLVKDEDILRQRKPILRLADPIIRFHDVVISPRFAAFESRDTVSAWSAAQPALRSQLYGPAFEQLAREWTARCATEETTGGAIGEVGSTVVNDKVGKAQHEVDIVALKEGQRRQDRHPVIRVIGEAKDSDRKRGNSDLVRLERIRSLLVSRGIDAGNAKLLLFGRSGFDSSLTSVANKRSDVELVDLQRIRHGS